MYIFGFAVKNILILIKINLKVKIECKNQLYKASGRINFEDIINYTLEKS
jgi:hypothetical protein